MADQAGTTTVGKSGADSTRSSAKPPTVGSKSGEPRVSIPEGIDHDTALWHGRKAAVDVLTTGVEAVATGQGTVMGVIFPCTANILGVILFLRLPWIVGKAGILQSFLLVLVCCSCTFITTLSLSAIATNGKILGGGSYYLISRSLGPAVGAGVGLCFYMANSVGAAMYLMGCVEAWEIAKPDWQIAEPGDINNIRVTAFVLLLAALLINNLGVKFVSRLGTMFLITVFCVIGCMYIGLCTNEPSMENFSDNFGAAYDEEQKAFPKDDTEHGFVSLMALWFPAVTGIMAGSNRSADLKDPASSIPKGTLFAQLSTSTCYLSFVVFNGCAMSRKFLLDDPFFAATYAWPFKEVVIYGVMASTIGAALTSLVSGSRLLSAIASDGTLPILKVFAVRPGREPRLALLASGILCACAIGIGQLNAVAPVLTMFFLMCYTCVNSSCVLQTAVQDPNWRPRFRFYHWSVSLIGALLCVWMMFAISYIYALAAICFCSVVFAYATYSSHEVKWGDGFQGVKYQLAKNILMKIDNQTHTKNWRPQILVVTAATQSEDRREASLTLEEPRLLDFVSELKGGRGITIVGAVCEESATKSLFVHEQGEVQDKRDSGHNDSLEKILQKHQIKGFSQLVRTKDFNAGVYCLIQTAGLGAFQPNCVLTAWPEKWRDEKQGELLRSRFFHTIETAVEMQKVMLVAKGLPEFPNLSTRLGGTIDIWWIVADGGILLLLPFLLQKDKVWQACSLRLFALSSDEEDPLIVKSKLEMYLSDFRLKVEVHVKTLIPSTKSSSSGPNADDIDQMARNVSAGSYIIPRSISAGSFIPRNASTDSYAGLRRRQESNGSDDVPVRLNSKDKLFTMLTGKRGTGFPELPPSGFQRQTSNQDVRSRADSNNSNTREAAASAIPSNTSNQAVVSGQIDPAMASAGSPQDRILVDLDKENEELELVKGLNKIIRSESDQADLLVTNLPDLPPGESLIGYFTLIEELTKGLKRCLLVRGTATEVITAFS